MVQIQSRQASPAMTPRGESTNPFTTFSGLTQPPSRNNSKNNSEISLVDVLSAKAVNLNGAKAHTDGLHSGTKRHQLTHSNSTASHTRVQRRLSRSSTTRAHSRSISSGRPSLELHSTRWHIESNPHVRKLW